MINLLRRRANQDEIEADVEAYLAEKIDGLIADGLTPDEARLQARREFGNVTLLKELSADEWSWGGIELVMNDMKYAVRSLLRNPAFAITAIFTLALGIGANAAIFNLLHAVILRALPVPDAQQLRLLTVVGPQEAEPIFSYPVFRQMQDAAGKTAGIAAFSSLLTVQSVAPQQAPEQAVVQLVSGNYFSALHIKPQLGHLLSASDDGLTGSYPAVLSDGYWSQHFGRDPGVIGRSFTLNGASVTVTGIAARGFFGLDPGSRPDFWVPVSAQFDLRYNHNVWNSNGKSDKPFITQPEIRWLSLVARLPEASKEGQALAAINQIFMEDMRREVKGWLDDPVSVRNILQNRVHLNAGEKGLGDLREQFSEPLLILMSAAGMVLLIASVNLASLALARVIARRKELAVRCSIGATRGRIMRHFVTEVLILSLAGGLIAIPVALGASRLLIHWASRDVPLPLDIGLDASTLLFVLAASVFAGLLFGLLPILEAINFPLADVMKATSTSVKGMRLPWGRTLIAIQVMFSFVLLTGAVLFVRTFLNYSSIKLGFAPEHVLSVQVDPLGARIPVDQLLPTYHRVLERIKEVPGVQTAAFAEHPLALHSKSVSGVHIEGQGNANQDIQTNAVNPAYFAVVGMRLVKGRLFTEHDLEKKPLLAVINEKAARQFFSDVNPIGRHFGYDGQTQFEVIGIVADARVNDLHEAPRPMTFLSLDQAPDYARSLEVRAQGDPRAVEQSVREAIRESASNLPIMKVRLLTDQVDGNLFRERLIARLASAFAVLALALACLGVYGVLSYAVTRRTSELGIRLALGAKASAVRWLVLREALSVILIGLALGVPVAIAMSTLIRTLLYGLSATDPVGLASSALLLLAIGFLAAFFPAWRASRVDPNIALRYE